MPKEPKRTPRDDRAVDEDLVVKAPPEGGRDVIDRPTGGSLERERDADDPLLKPPITGDQV